MKLRDQYDWIVLGDHPAALLSGALVARLGLSVLILDLVPRAKIFVGPGNQCLDPETNFLLGFEGAGPFAGLLGNCLGRLGVSAEEKAERSTRASLPELVEPTARVVLRREKAEFAREWAREFAAAQPVLAVMLEESERLGKQGLEFWRTLPARLTLAPEKSRGRKTRESAGRPEEASHRKALRGLEIPESMEHMLFDLAQGIAPEFDLARDRATALSMIEAGRTGSGFRGGLSAYREFLLGLARRLGAHIPSEAARTVFVEDGRLVGVQTSQKNTVISAAGAVLGCSIDHAVPQISLSGRKWLHRLKSGPVPGGWKFTLALTVRSEAIPEAAQSRVIWAEEGAPPLEVEVADAVDYGISEPEHRFVFLRTILPFEDESLHPENLRKVASRMFRQASELFPFMEFHVVRMFPDFRSDAFLDVTQAFDFDSVRMIPSNLRTRYSNGIGSRSGIEGLFVATDEAFPELGSLGGTVAALEATAWIAHRRGIAGPFA